MTLRRTIHHKLNDIARLTERQPGKHTVQSLAYKFELSTTTVYNYSKENDLKVKKKFEYSPEQMEFVQANAETMTNSQICKALKLKPYQVQDIGNKLGVSFYVIRPKAKVETEFFEHHPFYI